MRRAIYEDDVITLLDKGWKLGVYPVASNIHALPSAQTERQWIPCSERLPEYGEPVLTWDGYIYCVEKRIPYICDEDGDHIVSDWWVSDDYDEYESDYYPNLRDGAATAWMPLPEPYAERRKE